MSETLFGITEQHIRIILQLTYTDLGGSHDDLVKKAHRLAQTDARKAAEYMASHNPAAFKKDNDEEVGHIVDWIEHRLNHPDELPKPLQIPTFEDCAKLADPDTEAGRVIGWLLGIWPDPEKTMNVRPPETTAIGDVNSDEPGATWAWITPRSLQVCERTDAHPWSKKTVYQTPMKREQMVGLARWLLMNARQVDE